MTEKEPLPPKNEAITPRMVHHELEMRGLLVQSKLLAMIDSLIDDCVERHDDGDITIDFGDDRGRILDLVSTVYNRIAVSDSARLNSLKPPASNIYIPDKADRPPPPSVVPFPGNIS